MANLIQSSGNSNNLGSKCSCCHSTDKSHSLEILEHPNKITFDKSTKIDDKKRLLSRARRKYLSSNLSLQFINYLRVPSNPIPTNTDRERLIKTCWTWYNCAGALVLQDGKITSKYCGNRMCYVCNGIRTGKHIKKYKPMMDTWDNSYFLTLTLPNVYANDLRKTIQYMNNTFCRIKQMLYKRELKGTGSKLVGIKKLECTYNHKTNKYHPHFHFILSSKENGVDLLNEWLKRTKHLGTSKKAQDLRLVKKDMSLELFKYHTKLVSKAKDFSNNFILSNLEILKAFRYVRTISHFGFETKDEEEELEDISSDAIPKDMYDDDDIPKSDVYNWVGKDWYSITNGLPLTKHEPTDKMLDFVEEYSLPPP